VRSSHPELHRLEVQGRSEERVEKENYLLIKITSHFSQRLAAYEPSKQLYVHKGTVLYTTVQFSVARF